MDDLISRQAVIDAVYERIRQIGYDPNASVLSIRQAIRDLPSAQPEQKTGQWIDTDPELPDLHYRKNGMAYACSVCGHRAGKRKHTTYKYCPWCGAKMEGNDE